MFVFADAVSPTVSIPDSSSVKEDFGALDGQLLMDNPHVVCILIMKVILFQLNNYYLS